MYLSASIKNLSRLHKLSVLGKCPPIRFSFQANVYVRTLLDAIRLAKLRKREKYSRRRFFFLLFNNVSGYKAPRRRSASRYTEKTMVLLLPCYRASLERALKPKYVRNYAQRAVLLAALNNAGATFTFSLQNTQTHAVIVSPSFLHKLDVYGVRIMALSIKFVTVRVKFTQYKVLAFILFTFIVSYYKHCLGVFGHHCRGFFLFMFEGKY